MTTIGNQFAGNKGYNMTMHNVILTMVMTFVGAFILGLITESGARNKSPYVIEYRKAEANIKKCEAALPRNKHCGVVFKFETKVAGE